MECGDRFNAKVLGSQQFENVGGHTLQRRSRTECLIPDFRNVGSSTSVCEQTPIESKWKQSIRHFENVFSHELSSDYSNIIGSTRTSFRLVKKRTVERLRNIERSDAPPDNIRYSAIAYADADVIRTVQTKATSPLGFEASSLSESSRTARDATSRLRRYTRLPMQWTEYRLNMVKEEPSDRMGSVFRMSSFHRRFVGPVTTTISTSR